MRNPAPKKIMVATLTAATTIIVLLVCLMFQSEAASWKTRSQFQQKKIIFCESKIVKLNLKVKHLKELLKKRIVPVSIIRGRASFYGGAHHGKPTATGTTFDMNGYTAAVMPPNTRFYGHKAIVTNMATGEAVIVLLNDTGDFTKYGRVIDLSKAAFEIIGNIPTGVLSDVRIEVLSKNDSNKLRVGRTDL